MEAIEHRRLANMAAMNPARYEQLYPKSATELAAIELERKESQFPKTVDQQVAEITNAAELAKWSASIDAIMHPVPMTDEMIQTAIRNDPKGPWAIVFKK
jgi:hypothetical protein